MKCLNCGGVNLRKRSKYCSESCYNKAYGQRYYEKHKQLIPVTDRDCEQCGIRFTPHERTKSVQKYCSPSCLRKAMHIRSILSGRKKINSAKHYKKNKEKIRQVEEKRQDILFFSGNKEVVLERDGHKCTQCGVKDDLVIHHIDKTGLSTVGNREHVNNDVNNLVTLCRSCHLKEHQKDPMNKKHISKEDILSAMEGRNLEEAASYLGITRKTLALKRKEYGIGLRRKELNKDLDLSTFTQEQVESALQSLKKLDDAAEFLGMSRSSLCKLREQFNLPMRRKHNYGR